jgi:predicted enzyme related to lactoylglutathione lyase
MAIVEKHPAGAFNWIELSTSDQNGAKTFYTSLFGWSIVDSPMGESAELGTYTMFKLDGLDVGAAYTTMPDEVKMGVPPHWNLYVASDDADKTAAQAKELGGKVLAGPFDVMTFGRMAVIADPTGAVFCIWQPKSHIGIRLSNQPGAFCWADLNTPDQTKDEAFYKGLFGWKIAAGEDGSDYLHIQNDGKPIGGVPGASMRDPNVPPSWLIYLQVEDCAAITAKAKELGANILMGNMHMDHVGNFTVMADPQGAVFAVYQPEH